MQQISSKSQSVPDWEPAPQPVTPSLPDWKNPVHFPTLPTGPVNPAIHPTEPWSDPEPKHEPPLK
jgi:hypothetical protein